VALLCLRSEADGPVDPDVARLCTIVEEVVLPAVGRWRQRARWAGGIVRGLPPWASDCSSDEYAQRLRRILEQWRPDIVQLDLQVMAQYVTPVTAAKVPRILVDYDPPSAWAAELVAGTHGARRLVRRAEATAWRRYERATRPRFDRIVVFADRDVAAVAPSADGVPIVTIPLGIDVPAAPLDPVGGEPPTVLFVGSFGHPPNVDAARWLAESIFPRVRAELPGARLQLVGHRPGAEVFALSGDGVEVHGSVPDVTPFLAAAAVVAAPIRLGGSIRMKVLETLAAGKALVATPRAMEGTPAVAGRHFVAADGEDEVVGALVLMLGDVERRRSLAVAARSWAVAELGWARPVEAFERVYADVLAETVR
jgi:glycosyltransferase involved in cell wall biosynthesis